MSIWNVKDLDIDPIYEKFRDTKHPNGVPLREKISEMWKTYEPYADKDYISEFSRNFTSRYWEMSVGNFLLEQGFTLSSDHRPKDDAGPDLCIILDNKNKIWVECIAPTVGEEKANKIPETPTLGEVFSPPKREVELRITNSVYDKSKKIIGYKERGIVEPSDLCIIAISFGNFPTQVWASEIDLPVSVKALFPIGELVGHFSTKDRKLIKAEHEVSTVIKKIKNVGSKETTDIDRTSFMSDEYSHIAGILTHEGLPSSDEKFKLIINPNGKPLFSSGSFKNVSEYDFEIQDSTFIMKPNEY